MADHSEINQFFEEILGTLIRVVPKHADIKNHISELKTSIKKHAKVGDKYALDLKHLNDTELEVLLRFVEKPGNRHHIAEIEKLWKKYGAEEAGKILLKHFYEHNKNHLVHADKLKHLK